MKPNSSPLTFDRQLYLFCQQVATIYYSSEFKRLNKEVTKIYRKKGVHHFKIVAFQDSLYSIYLEQHDGEDISESHDL